MSNLPQTNRWLDTDQPLNCFKLNSSTKFSTLRLCAVVLALVITALLQSPGRAYAHEDKVVAPDGTLHSPVEVQLAADHAPKPGEVVNLSLNATTYMATSGMTILWQVDNGAELLGGAASETFQNPSKAQPIQLSRQVRFPREGIYAIVVAAQIEPFAGMSYGGVDTLYFIVKADGTSTLTRQDPNAKSPMHSIVKTTFGTTAQPVSAAQTSEDPCYTISGKIQRVERTPLRNGYAPDTLVPVRFAEIFLYEEDPIADDQEGVGNTNADGTYSFDFCDDDGLGGGGLELYLVLRAVLYGDGHQVVYVQDSSYIDEVYEYSSELLTPPEGGSFTIDMELNRDESGPFNIADAIFDAYKLWKQSGGASGGDSYVDYTAEVNWEPGYYEVDPFDIIGTTFYDGSITVGAISGNDDTWDDSPIIHEYGHLIEDHYSCDESWGGTHNFDEVLGDPEFAWSEGYNDYFQSAVRQSIGDPNAAFYIDREGITGTMGSSITLENWDIFTGTTTGAAVVSPNNEMAIAAMFWDLEDMFGDRQDKVNHGYAMIQEVYTDDEFNDQFGDEECTVNEFFRAWQALNKPADTATAAVIAQNTGVANPFTTVNAASPNEPVDYTMVDATGKATDYQWWKHLIMVSDVSKSMEGDRINAVKTVLNEQVNDIAQTPQGVEFSLYSFDNTKTSNNTLLSGKFYADLVTPTISALSTNSVIDPCPVESLRALSQAIGPKQKGDAWLFTDGDATQSVAVETLVKSLNSHKIKGSIALLGNCGSLPPAPTNVSGASKNYLGLAANASQQGGIVPYLLTAIGSGGQFLYVDQGNVNDAADILRAQLSHSAGAGRWSDYVSDNPTYLYDKLASWEYKWIDTSVAAGGVNRGVPNPQVSVPLPAAFSFYGTAQNNAYVTNYGYLTFGAAPFAVQSNNSALPNASVPNNALYVLWENLFWNNPPTVAAANQPNQADAIQVDVFSKQDGDWYAISTVGSGSTQGDERAYQVLLNSNTGEIRYQYKSFIDSSGATIGLENGNGTIATQVSLNDSNGAQNGMGYKFTPAPAQPSKTFTVSVDGLMSSVGFLLSGYSGTFDLLDVRTPDNSQIDCNDKANVLCLNLGLVQYVQVKVNGRKGLWRATVSAIGSDTGTFSFSSIGASTITAESKSDRNLSTGAQTIAMKLEKAVTGNQLSGWFTKPNGQRFGANFHFFDDGAHNDGKAGDGRFGSDAFTPPGAGVAYLWVQGTVDGESFIRSEPTPFNFQPLEVTALGDGQNFGDKTALVFSISNRDTVKHCYDRTTQVPSGWGANWNFTITEFMQGLCLDAGQTVTRAVDIHMGGLPNDLPSAANGEVFVTFIEKEEGTISDSTSATVTRYRSSAYIVINNKTLSTYLRPNGVDTTTLQIFVYDDQNVSVADGSKVQLASSLGSITPTLLTEKGQVKPIFTTGLVEGKAVITAMIDSLVATTTIRIASPIADTLVLTSSLSELPANVNNATLTAIVHDQWGNPVANQSVRLSISGDGDMGTVNGSEVLTATTNANGQLVATYARGSQTGKVIATAQLVVNENNQTHLALPTDVTINVLGEAVTPQQRVFLPLLSR